MREGGDEPARSSRELPRGPESMEGAGPAFPEAHSSWCIGRRANRKLDVELASPSVARLDPSPSPPSSSSIPASSPSHSPLVCSASFFLPTMFSFWFSTSSKAVASRDRCSSLKLMSVEARFKGVSTPFPPLSLSSSSGSPRESDLPFHVERAVEKSIWFERFAYSLKRRGGWVLRLRSTRACGERANRSSKASRSLVCLPPPSSLPKHVQENRPSSSRYRRFGRSSIPAGRGC